MRGFLFACFYFFQGKVLFSTNLASRTRPSCLGLLGAGITGILSYSHGLKELLGGLLLMLPLQNWARDQLG